MSLNLAIANLGVEVYISSVREFELPNKDDYTNNSVNCICVLWLPYEDPLEIFGLQQGIRWDPILGRRCTGVAVARPCTKPGKLKSLECDFTTYIHALNVAKVKYVHNKEINTVSDKSDSEEISCSEKSIGKYIGNAKFENALKFCVEFPHKHYNNAQIYDGKYCIYNPNLDEVHRLLSPDEDSKEPMPIFVSLGYISETSQNSRVFRPASKWRRPMNAIGDGRYNLENSDPINWIGTAVITKEDWIRSYTSGRVFPLKLLPHYQLMSLVADYRKQILDENNIKEKETKLSFINSLMSEIEKFKVDISNSRLNGGDANASNEKCDNNFGTIQIQIKTFVSYPIRTEGALKPLVTVYNRQDLKNQFFLASLCYVDVILLDNVPAWSDIDIWDIAHSKIHICVVWKHERRILHQGGNALELFPYRCVKINGLPENIEFKDMKTIKEKNMKMRCLFSGRVLLTPVPGSEPDIYIYMLLNGKPFSCIRDPISMRNFDPSTSNYDKYYDLDRIDSSVESVIKEFETRGRFSGTLKCKVNVWPDNSCFLSRKEYSYLNLRPQKGIVYNILHDYQTKMPDHYSAPTLGPYGVWVGYSVNDKSDEFIDSKKFQNLFDEAIYQMNSATHEEKQVIPIEDYSYNRKNDIQSDSDENFSNDKYLIDTKINAIEQLDQEYIEGDLKRFNQDIRSFKPYVPHMSTLLGSGINPGVAGEWITFIIQSRDEDGNKSCIGKSKIHIRLRSVGYIKYTFTAEPYGLEYKNPNNYALINVDESEVCKVGVDQIDVPIEWCSVESYHGVYNCRMRCERSGQYLLRVTMDGLPIGGSPYDVTITPSIPEAKASSTIGEGTVKCKACPTVNYMIDIEAIKACKGKVPKYINSFIVILCDEFGNRISTGGHQLKVKCNSKIGKIHAIYDNWDGSYVVYYTIHLEKTIQNFDQKIIDKINSICYKKNNSNQLKSYSYSNPTTTTTTTTTRAIEQALGVSTRVSNSKIDFNSEELGGLFNTRKLQHMTNFEYNDEHFLESEEVIITNICDLEISVYLNNRPIYGSPFTPYIDNLVEIRNWYRIVDLNSSDSTERKFEKLLESDDFEGAIKLMKELERKYLHDFKVILEELERDPTEQEQILDNVGKISNEQDQWTLLQKNKQRLEQIIRDNNDRENLILTFGRFLLKRLENQMIRRQKVDSDLSSYRILKENNLEPLCHSLEVEYNKFQQQRTRELIRLVSLLETNKLNSLEELMELYQLIADELRSLGRGNLANQFDLVNRCLIEEQQLTNIRESLQRKSEVLAKMDEMVTTREKALEMILSNYNQAIKMEEDHIEEEIEKIKVDILRKLNFNPSTGVQTEDSLSFTDTIVGPLILDRILGNDENQSKNDFNNNNNNHNNDYKSNFNKHFSIIDHNNSDYAIHVMKMYWKPLMEWDLKCFVKILKQCPRISICLRELFSYFANTRWKNNETQMSIYGDLIHKSENGNYYSYKNNNFGNNNETEESMNNNNNFVNNILTNNNDNLTSIDNNNHKFLNKENIKSISKWTVGTPLVTSDDPNLSMYRKAMGITRNGFKRLIISLNLSPELIKSEKTIEGLFHKYSMERTTSNIHYSNKNVRVITQELWIPLLRELAYINALVRFDVLRQSTLGSNALLRLYKNINDFTGKVDYSVWENNISSTNIGEKLMINLESDDFKGLSQNLINSKNKINDEQNNQNNMNKNKNNNNNIELGGNNKNHALQSGVAVTQDNIKDLNRVTAFRHFCELHLIPLYKQVYGNEDFTTMLMLPFSKILSSEQDELLRGLDAIDLKDSGGTCINSEEIFGDNSNKELIENKKRYLSNQSTHEKVECKINNCLKIVVSQLKMNIASAIFIQLASKSMKEYEFDITRELVEFKRITNDDDILKNYYVTEFDYIKPLQLHEYLTNIGIIPGHISGNEMHKVVEKVLSSREEYLPKELPVTYKYPKSLSFPGYIETLSMCIAKGIVNKLSGSLWSEGDIRTEVIEHLVLFNLYDTSRI
ncbi:Filamin/ABP280 repeat containing protein [Cryptosporidium hominis]|uniref:Filamin/ABP280 repeat containing protein n=3 Tax=Cryptosporidium hominis TaxID=237895 RepID=A0ABX5BJH9_CRYHO|nr:Filamin/ABP280 repeat containing protein [Cryptosporidium hominis]|eukprot:PPS97955.1 Filamin/ABP280 repeat containing protein [Cryptosporidium hominis]